MRSALDDIPGVGEACQKRLLSHFGSVRAMREADVEDFEQVKGVGKAKAAAISSVARPRRATVDGMPFRRIVRKMKWNKIASETTVASMMTVNIGGT